MKIFDYKKEENSIRYACSIFQMPKRKELLIQERNPNSWAWISNCFGEIIKLLYR